MTNGLRLYYNYIRCILDVMGKGIEVSNKRSYRIDILKAIAIIAIFLYHFSNRKLLPFGYLGVEVFLVISGYLMMSHILKEMDNGAFRYWKYILSRFCRLALPTFFIVLVVYILGYVFSAPESYRTLARNGISTVFFVNNITEGITSTDYWGIANDYMPLMHTWYLGILMQAYVLLAGIIVLVNRVSKRKKSAVRTTLLIVTLVSLCLYLFSKPGSSDSFYFLQYRLFEISSGCCLAFLYPPVTSEKRNEKFIKLSNLILVILLLCLIGISANFLNVKLRLLSTVLIACMLIAGFKYTVETDSPLLKAASQIGKLSFSIYLCHQMIFAFYRSLVSAGRTYLDFIIVTSVTIIFSLFLWYCIEKPAAKYSKSSLKAVLSLSVCTAVVLVIFGGYVYLNGGIVRDIPELNIKAEEYKLKNDAWSKSKYDYVNKPCDWNRDFADDTRIKALVFGNSFARDWCNILNESEIHDQIQISYVESLSEDKFIENIKKIESADFVFCTMELKASLNYKNGLPEYIEKYIPKEKLYVIGDKQYGTRIDWVYARRNNPDYHSITVKQDPDYLELCKNDAARIHYGTRFIDMMQPVTDSNGLIQVFTDQNKFISWDCRHLTRDGAGYYADLLDIPSILISRQGKN